MVDQNTSIRELGVPATNGSATLRPRSDVIRRKPVFPEPRPVRANSSVSVKIGDRILHLAQASIEGPDGIRPIEPKAMAVLLLLAGHSGKAVSRKQLLAECWDDPGVTNEALTSTICALRKQLCDNPRQPRFIRTVRNGGYALIASTKVLDAANDPVAAGERAAAMDKSPTDGESWFADMVRRRVFRVLGAYTLVGWVLLQVAEIVFPAVSIPDWCLTLLLLLLVLGFPLAAVLAWAVQVTGGGLVLDMPVRSELTADSRNTAARLQVMVILALGLVACGLGYRVMTLENRVAMAADIQTVQAIPDRGAEAD